jgi:transcriptional regulator with XRE-family HTH domain
MESDESTYALLMITPAQCRAARGLLNWTQRELADQAGVGIVTVRQFEAGVNEPRRATLEVVKRAFETAGIEFIAADNGGVGLRLSSSGRGKRR